MKFLRIWDPADGEFYSLLLDRPAEKQGGLVQAMGLQVVHGQKMISVKK